MTRSLIISFALVLGACQGNNGTMAPPTGPGAGSPDLNGAYLQIMGPSTIMLPEGELVELNARYLSAAGAPIPGQTVSFAIEAGAAGAQLSGYNAVTDSFGIARVNLRAGTEATFPVTAVAPTGGPVSWTVQVRQMGDVVLDITPRYTGTRSIPLVEVAVFQNYRCADFAAGIPNFMARRTTNVGQVARFNEVSAGMQIAVWALGVNTGQVAAAGCIDAWPNGHTAIPVDMMDVSTIQGRFNTEHTLNLSGSLRNELHILLDELSQLSNDPAGYLVDIAIDSLDLPSWAQSVLSASPIRFIARELVNEVIKNNYSPFMITDLARAGRELQHSFASLTLVGTLDVSGDVDAHGQSTGTHQLRELRIPLTDGSILTRALNHTAMVTVSFNERDGMRVADHQFAVPFGEIVDMVLDEIFFSKLPGRPHDVRNFVGDLVRCDMVKHTQPYDTDPLISAATEAACFLGSEIIIDDVEDLVEDLWAYDTVTLSAHAVAVDANRDFIAERYEGSALATWNGEAGMLRADGTSRFTPTSPAMQTTAGRVYDRLVGR